MRVGIVGGGVVGLTCAFRLAQKGVDVALFDRNEPGQKASWAGAGILPVANPRDPQHPLEQLAKRSNELHPGLSAELLKVSGIDNQFVRCGGIHLALTTGEVAALRGSLALWKEESIDHEVVTKEQLLGLEPELPELASQIRFAIRFPEEGQLRNPRHLQALIVGCQALGVIIHPQTEVREVKVRPTSVKLRCASGEAEFDKVCIANGAWASQLLGDCLPQVKVIPIKGHMLLYHPHRTRSQGFTFTHVLNHGNRYAVPRRDGYVLVGSNEEETGFDESVQDQEVQRLKEFASTLDPRLNDQSYLKTWTGLRPMSLDSVPFIGVHPRMPNLVVATGHYRSGLHLSPATAELVTQLTLGEKPAIDTYSLRPSR